MNQGPLDGETTLCIESQSDEASSWKGYYRRQSDQDHSRQSKQDQVTGLNHSLRSKLAEIRKGELSEK